MTLLEVHQNVLGWYERKHLASFDTSEFHRGWMSGRLVPVFQSHKNTFKILTSTTFCEYYILYWNWSLIATWYYRPGTYTNVKTSNLLSDPKRSAYALCSSRWWKDLDLALRLRLVRPALRPHRLCRNNEGWFYLLELLRWMEDEGRRWGWDGWRFGEDFIKIIWRFGLSEFHVGESPEMCHFPPRANDTPGFKFRRYWEALFPLVRLKSLEVSNAMPKKPQNFGW